MGRAGSHSHPSHLVGTRGGRARSPGLSGRLVGSVSWIPSHGFKGTDVSRWAARALLVTPERKPWARGEAWPVSH
ncbi:hypothetical protein MTP02_40770 [Streptomyces albus]|nr:hypothetical protein MTP02_40770 [Streptomyces albus]